MAHILTVDGTHEQSPHICHFSTFKLTRTWHRYDVSIEGRIKGISKKVKLTYYKMGVHLKAQMNVKFQFKVVNGNYANGECIEYQFKINGG